MCTGRRKISGPGRLRGGAGPSTVARAMELRIEHEVPAAIDRVEAARLDPALLRRLPEFAPGIAEARELSRERLGDAIVRVAVCRAAFVPGPLVALIPAAWTTWLERTRWDLRTRTASFTIEPQIPRALRRRVGCAGRYALVAVGERRTRRTIEVALRIDAPVIGRRAEATLATMITQQFAGEAALLAALAGAPG